MSVCDVCHCGFGVFDVTSRQCSCRYNLHLYGAMVNRLDSGFLLSKIKKGLLAPFFRIDYPGTEYYSLNGGKAICTGSERWE